MAFAIVAGLPPEYGLFTAIITPVIAAIWGSSMVMISGPTTRISAVLFATLSSLAPPGTPDYINLALTLTIVANLFQITAGLLRLGALISFISHSVMVGFTAAALLIAVLQLGPALGVAPERGGGVIERLGHIVAVLGDIEPLAVSISAVTFATIVLFQKVNRKIPSYLIALVGGGHLGRNPRRARRRYRHVLGASLDRTRALRACSRCGSDPRYPAGRRRHRLRRSACGSAWKNGFLITHHPQPWSRSQVLVNRQFRSGTHAL